MSRYTGNLVSRETSLNSSAPVDFSGLPKHKSRMGATKSKAIDNAKAWNSACRKKKVLLLGLDAVGKTHLFTRLLRHSQSPAKNERLSRPTRGNLSGIRSNARSIVFSGYNVETIKVRHHYQTQQITLWDCGGEACVRPLWSYHYPDTSLLLWVINAHDRARLDSSLHSLSQVLSHPLLGRVPVLIVLDHSPFDREEEENLLSHLEVAFRFLATLSSSRASSLHWQVINMTLEDDLKKIEHSFRCLMKF